MAQKCKKCVLERSDRNHRQQPSVNIRFGAICQKVKKNHFFQKNKTLQKVTFAFLHTCTAFSLDLGGQNRKSATFCTFCTLALPNRPSRTFAYVYDVFARSARSKITFCTFGPDLVESTTLGRRTLNRGVQDRPTECTHSGNWKMSKIECISCHERGHDMT